MQHAAQSRPKLRTPGAARYLGLAISTLEKLRHSGGGPDFAKLGKPVVYDPDDLDAWLAANKRRSTAAIPPKRP